jgi:hypothetical protein
MGTRRKPQHFSAGMKPQVHMFDNPDGKAYSFTWMKSKSDNVDEVDSMPKDNVGRLGLSLLIFRNLF